MPDTKTKDYLKVRQEGGSTVLTVGKHIPKEWQLVVIRERRRPSENVRVLEVKRIV